MIKGFYKGLINEWVSQGNKAEKFQEKGQNIMIILDNAMPAFIKKKRFSKK